LPNRPVCAFQRTGIFLEAQPPACKGGEYLTSLQYLTVILKQYLDSRIPGVVIGRADGAGAVFDIVESVGDVDPADVFQVLVAELTFHSEPPGAP